MLLLAHADRALAPHDAWGAWTLDPGVVVGLTALAFLYTHTVRALWRTGGRGAGIPEGRVVTFAAGMLVLVAALVSPLDALSESLFAAHMVQHLLLTLVAAPLLLLGRAHLGILPVLPLGLRRRAARRLAPLLRREPAWVLVGAVTLHLAAVLAWHVPVLYDVALRQPVVHATEHVTLLGSALAFWSVLGAGRSGPVAAAGLAAFVASLVSVLLAATMTAATQPWYVSHLDTTAAWGLTPLQDQHLAAAIMWVPGGLVYLGAAAIAFHGWIRADERRLHMQRHPTPPPPGPS